MFSYDVFVCYSGPDSETSDDPECQVLLTELKKKGFRYSSMQLSKNLVFCSRYIGM